MESRICQLPDEIVSDILLRLPPKSVQICRCACKAFNSLTKSPNFIASHCSRPSTETTNTLCSLYYRSMIRDHNRHNYYVDHTLLVQADENFVVSLKPMSTPIPNNFCIVGHSNGLFCVEEESCFMGTENRIMFWNPVTKQTRYLPPPPPKSVTHGWSHASYGFGFVRESNSYKLVRIINNGGRVISAPDIQVYRTSSDCWSIIKDTSITLFDSLPKHIAAFDSFCKQSGVWRRSPISLHDVEMDIEGAISEFRLDYRSSAESFKGAFHWIGLIPIPFYRMEDWDIPDDDECFVGIVSFDLRDERLRLVDLLSSDMIPVSYSYASLGILRESLCLIVSNHILGKSWDIWLMKDYGIRESWTKQFCFTQEYIPRCCQVLACSKDYLLIIEGYEKTRLSTLNLGTLDIKSFPISDNCYESLACFSFVETLVPVSATAEDVNGRSGSGTMLTILPSKPSGSKRSHFRSSRSHPKRTKK